VTRDPLGRFAPPEGSVVRDSAWRIGGERAVEVFSRLLALVPWLVAIVLLLLLRSSGAPQLPLEGLLAMADHPEERRVEGVMVLAWRESRGEVPEGWRASTHEWSWSDGPATGPARRGVLLTGVPAVLHGGILGAHDPAIDDLIARVEAAGGEVVRAPPWGDDTPRMPTRGLLLTDHVEADQYGLLAAHDGIAWRGVPYSDTRVPSDLSFALATSLGAQAPLHAAVEGRERHAFARRILPRAPKIQQTNARRWVPLMLILAVLLLGTTKRCFGLGRELPMMLVPVAAVCGGALWLVPRFEALELAHVALVLVGALASGLAVFLGPLEHRRRGAALAAWWSLTAFLVALGATGLSLTPWPEPPLAAAPFVTGLVAAGSALASLGLLRRMR